MLFKNIKYFVIVEVITIIIVLINFFNSGYIQVFSQKNDPCISFKLRLEALEPKKPISIDSTPIPNIAQPSKMLPISEVIKNGKEIDIEWAYNDINWIRPAYKTYWHSTVDGGRWSYVPMRINYALHRIFSTYRTSSFWYSIRNQLGIYDESLSFDFKDHYPLDYVTLIVMQSNVKRILTLGNQVVVIIEPKRTGLQVIDIPLSEIKQYNPKEPIIFQLVSPEGYEIDYSLFEK